MTKPVLFITRKWSPAIGGMETYSIKVVEHLRTKTPVQVLHPKMCNTGRPKLFPLLWFFIAATFHVLVKGRNYSCIHLGDAVLYPLSFLARCYNLPTFITFHGLDLQYALKPSFKGRIYKIYLSCLRYAPISCAFPNSNYTASLIPTTISRKVVPLGSDLQHRSVVTKTLRPTLTICYVGRVIPRKGLVWFIEEIFPYIDNCVLQVVGPTPSHICTKYNSPKIIWHSQVNEYTLDKLRQASDIFIVPNIPTSTDVEGFGLVCVENACYGVPVLVSNWQGLSDAVIEGTTGFLLEPGQPLPWIQKIEEIQTWTPKSWQNFALTSKKALPYYSWSRVVEDYISTYETYL